MHSRQVFGARDTNVAAHYFDDFTSSKYQAKSAILQSPSHVLLSAKRHSLTTGSPKASGEIMTPAFGAKQSCASLEELDLGNNSAAKIYLHASSEQQEQKTAQKRRKRMPSLRLKQLDTFTSPPPVLQSPTALDLPRDTTGLIRRTHQLHPTQSP